MKLIRISVTTIVTLASLWIGTADAAELQPAYQHDFQISSRNLVTIGRNLYFSLEPGYQLVYEGKGEKLVITVLPETEKVGDIATRVVEEREWQDGELYEVARNFFAMDADTRDILYFGETVDFYKDGKVVNHDGSWRAFENGNMPGLHMAGTPRIGMKYYQEVAPGVAVDHGEVVSLKETLETPAGTFTNCLQVKEGNDLKPKEKEFKRYAPGIGMIDDNKEMFLVSYGFLKQ